MPPFDFSSKSFVDFCRENNLSENEGFKIILEEINRLSEEKKQLVREGERCTVQDLL